jgi:hypothetical protein
MSDVPRDMPITVPVAASTVATDVFPLIHRPEGVMSVSPDVWPLHTFRLPDIAAGSGFTVMVTAREQPVASE